MTDNEKRAEDLVKIYEAAKWNNLTSAVSWGEATAAIASALDEAERRGRLDHKESLKRVLCSANAVGYARGVEDAGTFVNEWLSTCVWPFSGLHPDEERRVLQGWGDTLVEDLRSLLKPAGEPK